ncbi:MAG: hypothetical protein M5R36_23380 [Deltaproteobacteria bacterium]|nr:hypothetical protein [Deltaproteobacteria bacterium]
MRSDSREKRTVGGLWITRRRFFEFALGTAAALYVGPSVTFAAERAEPEAFSVDDGRWSIFEAVTDAIVVGDGFPAASTLPIRPVFNDMLGRMAAADRDQFLRLLNLLEYQPLFTHWSRFTNLGADDRRAVLAGWRDSSIVLRRQAFSALEDGRGDGVLFRRRHMEAHRLRRSVARTRANRSLRSAAAFLLSRRRTGGGA